MYSLACSSCEAVYAKNEVQKNVQHSRVGSDVAVDVAKNDQYFPNKSTFKDL